MGTFSPNIFYFLSPVISAILILGSYLILKRTYRPPKEHYLLYALSWLFLFIPQIIPPLFYGLNIIYVTWTFILATAVTAIVIFQDSVLINVNDVPRNERKFVYDELKFYLDKLFFGWLTLGTVLAVCMTILWTAPMTAFWMRYEERVFWAVYMVSCFLSVTLLVVSFVVLPISKSIRKLREAILHNG